MLQKQLDSGQDSGGFLSLLINILPQLAIQLKTLSNFWNKQILKFFIQ